MRHEYWIDNLLFFCQNDVVKRKQRRRERNKVSAQNYRQRRREQSAVAEKVNTHRKNPKISDTRKFAVITLKVELDGASLE